MHADPTFGVLDGWNRVHDVANVAVVDSSCFTTGRREEPDVDGDGARRACRRRLADDLGHGAI